MVAWVGSAPGAAGLRVQVETTVVDGGFVGVSFVQIVADGLKTVEAADGRRDVKNGGIGAYPGAAAPARPFAQVDPVGPVFVLESKLTGIHARATQLDEGRGVKRQGIEVAVKALHSVGEAAHLRGLCGSSPVWFGQAFAGGVNGTCVRTVGVVVKSNGRLN